MHAANADFLRVRQALIYVIKKRKTYVVAYDIVEDRARAKAANILKDYGVRMQKSVFECVIVTDVLEELRARLLQVIDTETDSILIYPLCRACAGKRTELGLAVSVSEEAFRVL